MLNQSVKGKIQFLFCLFVFAFCGVSYAALPQFFGGSGFGINGDKASLDGKYPTFWDNLMKQQSYENLSQGIGEMSALKYKEAADTFAKAVVKNPQDPYTHIFLGIALYWQGQVEPAAAEYRTALELDPKNAEALQLLGITYAWKGDIKSALKYFKKAIDIDANRPDTQMNLGSTYAALGDYDDALDHFRRAVELDGNHPLYRYQLGSLYEVMGRDSAAEDSFKKALRLYPQYEEALFALGALYEKTGSNGSAESYYKKALKLKPGDSVARLRLANILLKQNRRKEVLSILEPAFLISPISDQGLALSLAYAGGAAGGADKQLEQFRQRVEKIPSDRQVVIEAEVVFEPKMQPAPPLPVQVAKITENGTKVKKKQNKKSMFAKAVEEQTKVAASSVFNRSFSLNDTTPQGRAEQLDKIFNGLNNVLSEGGKKYNVKMSLRVRSKSASPGALSSGAEGSSSGGENNSKAGYNPYMVGNDMGLWVAGKGWITYAQEIMQEVSARADNGGGAELMTEGLGFIIVGQGQDALESFDKAVAQKDCAELGNLAKGTAFVILGDDKSAAAAYGEALKINPKDKTAAENLEILKK